MTGRGLFVSLEGGEGTGKSTQIRLLADMFTSLNCEVVTTREPGGTRVAEAIRSVILSDSEEPLSERAEALLFAAARAQHMQQLIHPAVERGAVVLTDRFLDSSVAYQGFGRSLLASEVYYLSMWATENTLPDITVLLTLPIEDGLRRANARSRENVNRLDQESLDFHQRVGKGFDSLAAAEPERFVTVEATGSPEEVQASIWSAIMRHPAVIRFLQERALSQ